LVLSLATAASGNVATPVEKVIELLGRLEKKIEAEGADEAKAYDKYACFCKEQSSDKQYAIEKSTEKIEMLDAEIQKLTTEITELDTEIGDLGTKITGLETDMDTKQTKHDADLKTFLSAQADVNSAIDAVTRAIEALKDSKKQLKGKAELEGKALIQVRAAAATALTLAEALSETQTKDLIKLAGEPGKAYTYKYSSNEIIATLENLKQTFKQRKTKIEQDEYDRRTAFELAQQALANEKKFAEKEKTEKEGVRESKSEEKETATTEKTEEEKDKTADSEFLGVLTTDCEGKAKLWDQRSKTRASELTAIAEATEALKSGVAPNYEANKKLVGLSQQAVTKGRSASFLQLSSLRGSGSAQVRVGRVQQFLEQSASSLKSPTLAAMALKVGISDDHFAKVRQIIKDLIAKLEEEATNEATQKSFCDKEMQAAVDKRDKDASDIEEHDGDIAAKTAKKSQLKKEIAELSADIANLKKALLEATELRNEEKEKNENTIKQAEEGKTAVEQALNVLKDFYNNAFLQKRAHYVPPNSDRDGKTVSDYAPEVFDSEYHGSQDSSKGIIGLLEVILSDFDRTKTTVTGEESQAVTDFDTFKTTTETDITTKEGQVTTKEGEITTLEDDLVTLKGDKKQAEESHKDAIAELEKLTVMCIEGEESYKERVEKRQKEIEALKEAMQILEDWKS